MFAVALKLISVLLNYKKNRKQLDMSNFRKNKDVTFAKITNIDTQELLSQYTETTV